MTSYRKTHVTVDLAAFGRNVRRLRGLLGPGVKLMAVVKADAYGHGLLEVSRAALRAGADWLGVAIPEEGVRLRQAGLSLPILVLGGTNEAGAHAAAAHGLTLTVLDESGIAFAQAAGRRLGRPVSMHLAMDTGMGRSGVRTPAELETLLSAIRARPEISLEGAFTHFADADNPDPSFTDLQLSRLRGLMPRLPAGLTLHAAASAASLSRKDAHFDMVRAGIALYGYPPVPTPLSFEPCLELCAQVVSVKTVGAGEPIGYGCAFTTQSDTRVALLDVGYADGYPRALSLKASVIIHGQLCPVLGRICMDQTMVDVSRVPQTQPGDEAVLLGRRGQVAITAEDLAALAGTITYEILLLQRRRLSFTYREDGDQHG